MFLEDIQNIRFGMFDEIWKHSSLEIIGAEERASEGTMELPFFAVGIEDTASEEFTIEGQTFGTFGEELEFVLQEEESNIRIHCENDWMTKDFDAPSRSIDTLGAK